MKISTVLIPHFLFKAELIRQPNLRYGDTLIVTTRGSHNIVADVSPGLVNVIPNTPLGKALTELKDVNIVEADYDYYQALFQDILRDLEKLSPVVEESALGCAYIDLNGLEGLYRSDTQMALAIQRAIPDHWGSRVGIGYGKFISYVAALSAVSGRPFKITIDGARFLRKLSIDILPTNPQVRDRLHEFALHTLGDVASLPVGPFQAQFGLEGRLIWELSNGIDNRPLTPRKYDQEVTESLSFSDPVVVLEAILVGAEMLLERILQRTELKDRAARLLVLQGKMSQGKIWIKRLSLKEPSNNRTRLMFRIRTSLQGMTLKHPMESLSITLSNLTREVSRQEGIFSYMRDEERLQDAIKQLDVLLGETAPVFRVREVEPWSRIPERRHALVQFVP